MTFTLPGEDGIEVEVLPCPFCGLSRLAIATGKVKEARYYVFCQVCGTNGPTANRRILAIFLWNTRNAPTPPQEQPT